MNERIRELAEQARVQDRGYFIYQYGDPISHQSVEKAINLEKFAELIVEECVLISRTSTDGFSAGNRMQEHFGVQS